MHATLGLLLFVILTAPSLARANVDDAVNWARREGCGSPESPLRDSPALRRAAVQLAAGVPLHTALSSVGYLARESSAVHLTGVQSDAAVSRLLAADECRVLQEPGIVEMGVERRGREVWIVLAAPFALPRSADAQTIRRQIVELVNQARQTDRHCGARLYLAVAPLSINAALSDAARAHSEDMAVHDEFDHQGHDGSSPASRVERAGYGRSLVVGENIAAGAMTPAEVVQGWLASPPHCENIMDPRFAELGIGFAVNPSSTELIFWTQDFASRHRPESATARASNP